MQRQTKWLATVGLASAVAMATSIGVATMAGATGETGATAATAKGGATSPATTVSFNFSATVSGMGTSGGTLSGTGVADLPNDSASLTVHVPAGVTKLIPGGSASPTTIDAVLSGGTLYLQIPALASKVGEPWISISLPSKAASDVNGALAKVAAALGNVKTIVSFAQAHHATVNSLGTSTVDGIQATGTKIVLSHWQGGSARVHDRTHGRDSTRAHKASAYSHKGSTHAHNGRARTVTATLWSDSSGRLVRATVATAGGNGPHGGLGITATVNFFGYGSPVTITVPPPSEVKSIPLSMIEAIFGKQAAGHRTWLPGHPSFTATEKNGTPGQHSWTPGQHNWGDWQPTT